MLNSGDERVNRPIYRSQKHAFGEPETERSKKHALWVSQGNMLLEGHL